MVVKAKAPQEDPETKARRLRAEEDAEDRQIRGIRSNVSRETAALLRRFGARAGGGFGGPPPVSGGGSGGAPSVPGGFGIGGAGGGIGGFGGVSRRQF